MKNNRQDKIVYLCVAFVGLAAFITTLFLKSKDAWMIPRILSAVIFLLGLAGFFQDVFWKDRHKPAEGKENQVFQPGELKLFLVYTAWIVGLAFAIYVFGFYIAMLVFCAAYLAWSKRKILVCILFSVIFTGVIYVLFEILVRSYLYKGLFFR